MRFSYGPQETHLEEDPQALQSLEQEINESVKQHGGIPAWFNWRSGRAWVVRGKPWREVFSLSYYSIYHLLIALAGHGYLRYPNATVVI